MTILTDTKVSASHDDASKLSIKKFLRILLRYFPLLKPYWSELLLLFMILPLSGAAIVVLPPLCTRMIIDVAFPRKSVWLLAGLGALAVLMLLMERLFLVIVRNLVCAHLRVRIMESLGRRFYMTMLSFNMRYHHNVPVGEKIFRCDTDIIDTSELLAMALPMTVQYCYQFIFMIAAMCVIDWRPVAVAAACSPLFFVVAQTIYNYFRRIDIKQREAGQTLTSRLEQSLSAISVVYSHGARRREGIRYYRDLIKYSLLNMVYWFMQDVSIVFVWPSGIPALFASYIIGLCAYWVVAGTMTIGQWSAMNQLIVQAILPLGILISYFQVMRLRMVPAERILNLLDFDAVIPEVPNAVKPLKLNGEIEFRDVHFSYDPSKTVLKGVTFKIKPGSRVAFVGPSGIGKSTIMSLILRFFDPDKGQILVDGIDIRTMKLHDYRKLIGIVLQEPVIFDRSIRANVLYGAHDKSEKNFKRAIDVAMLDEFVCDLHDGYETILQEGGNLSLGQKQRIAVARCMANQPNVVLLDEPTSLVDPASKKKIVASIDRATKGCTTIFISHDLLTLNNMDEIIVLNNGIVQEKGSHKQLMLENGLYCSLWNMQAKRNVNTKNLEYEMS